jgi:large subunit ribosomal protein L13
MSTYIPKIAEGDRKWYLLDAKGQVLGKLAVTAADILAGKRKPVYTPFLDTGDHVIVINASEIHLSGKKETAKVYRHHTGYLGSLKSAAAHELRQKRPTKMVEEAIKGMLPKTKLGRAMYGKLKVYAGSSHPHAAQKPQVVSLKSQKEKR